MYPDIIREEPENEDRGTVYKKSNNSNTETTSSRETYKFYYDPNLKYGQDRSGYQPDSVNQNWQKKADIFDEKFEVKLNLDSLPASSFNSRASVQEVERFQKLLETQANIEQHDSLDEGSDKDGEENEKAGYLYK